MADPLDALRSPRPTPADEPCSCAGRPPIKLMQALGANPLHCLECNREVPPERLGLGRDAGLVGRIVAWRTVYDALDRLWLDSGAYEAWALGELMDPGSAVNQRGRRLQQELDGTRRCYYWLAQDESAADFAPLRTCPACGRTLRDHLDSRPPQRLCEGCRFVVSADG